MPVLAAPEAQGADDEPPPPAREEAPQIAAAELPPKHEIAAQGHDQDTPGGRTVG